MNVSTVHAQLHTQWVDPLIGSGGHGHVFVGANVPFGAVQVGPMQRKKGWDWCSGYHYSGKRLAGFSHLHLSGTGIGDLGDILLMPMGHSIQDRFQGLRPAYAFEHRNESVRPGYYEVLMNNGIQVRLTASARAGFHQYRFTGGSEARVLIDLQTGILDKSVETFFHLLDPYTIQGYRVSTGWAKRQQVYFTIRTEQPIRSLQLYEHGRPIYGSRVKGKTTQAVIDFGKLEQVQLKVGLSPTQAMAAQRNLEQEMPNWDFEAQVRRAERAWESALSRIDIQTRDTVQKRIFYTALFHSMIHPSRYDDLSAHHATDSGSGKQGSTERYTIFSTWDTYRAAHALLAWVAPERMDGIIQSMLEIYDRQGYLPIWHLYGNETEAMPGISSVQMMAEAYLKGFRGFDTMHAYQAMRNTLMSDRRGLLYLRDLQPIPIGAGVEQPIAQALEFSHADAAMALMARALGKVEDEAYFFKRSQNYRLHFDTAVGFFRTKPDPNGKSVPFDPLQTKKPGGLDYAEGNAWQYLWSVAHDVDGLMQLLGGRERFLSQLDQFFSLRTPTDQKVLSDLTGSIGQYAHGNEPSHHIAYLYALAGTSGKTADLVRQIMRDFYTDRPDGLIGNEDCGQMSAWYVFSALGFYPVFPASQQYVVGSPLFEQATIQLGGGKTLVIEAKGNAQDKPYIQRATLNGKLIHLPILTHEQLMEGGVLSLEMGSVPR